MRLRIDLKHVILEGQGGAEQRGEGQEAVQSVVMAPIRDACLAAKRRLVLKRLRMAAESKAGNVENPIIAQIAKLEGQKSKYDRSWLSIRIPLPAAPGPSTRALAALAVDAMNDKDRRTNIYEV